jgi:hypothetical protein
MLKEVQLPDETEAGAGALLNRMDELLKLLKAFLEIMKMLGQLPLYKLSARMVYCMAFNIILLLFALLLRATGNQVQDFPNAWDFRFIIVISVVVFFVGISDMFKRGRH